MKLLLEREKPSLTCMMGSLFVDGEFECFTLEDVPRPTKIKGETAIPAGTYKVILTMSPRFKKIMPLLLNVPGFDGIRIHTGNTHADTEGCLVVGQEVGPDGESLLRSRAAYQPLFEKMQAATAAGQEIFIEIINSDAPI